MVQRPTADDGSLEQCVDELNDCMATLDRFSPQTLALALRAHLEGLLGALLEAGEMSEAEIREFIGELGQALLQQ